MAIASGPNIAAPTDTEVAQNFNAIRGRFNL